MSSVPVVPHNSFNVDSQISNSRIQGKEQNKGSADIWRVFRRLADPKQPVSIIRQRYLDKTGPVHTCAIKDTPAMRVVENSRVRCMCYENVLHFVRQVCCNSAGTKCRPFEPKQLPTKSEDFKFPDRWMRTSKKHYQENEKLQFPLASVVIRWQQKRYQIDYDHAVLLTIFSKFGTVREIRKLSPNSALIIFEELTAACHVIYSNYIGMGRSKLHCRWWHKCMESKAAVGRRKGVKIMPVPFL